MTNIKQGMLVSLKKEWLGYDIIRNNSTWVDQHELIVVLDVHQTHISNSVTLFYGGRILTMFFPSLIDYYMTII